jgi:hypothetical protein
VNSPQHSKLPNRRRFLELVMVAVVIVAAMCVVAHYTRPYPQSQASRALEDLRILDAAADQYSLENSHPASSAPATPAPKSGSK